jgi:hypothetical protein
MDDSKGCGITFTEQDLNHAKVLLAFLGKAHADMGFKSILETYPAFVWYANFVPAIERNIMEITKIIQPTKAKK